MLTRSNSRRITRSRARHETLLSLETSFHLAVIRRRRQRRARLRLAQMRCLSSSMQPLDEPQEYLLDQIPPNSRSLLYELKPDEEISRFYAPELHPNEEAYEDENQDSPVSEVPFAEDQADANQSLVESMPEVPTGVTGTTQQPIRNYFWEVLEASTDQQGQDTSAHEVPAGAMDTTQQSPKNQFWEALGVYK